MKKRLWAVLIALTLSMTTFMTACQMSTNFNGNTDPVEPTVIGGPTSSDPDAPVSGAVDVTEKSSEPGEQPESKPWTPAIIDDDPDKSIGDDVIDDSARYVYDNATVSFTAANGGYSTSGSGALYNLTATRNDSLIVSTTESSPFGYGTFSATFKPVADADIGIVFGLDSTSNYFWEGRGINYYFFFLGRDGKNAFLGETKNGEWYTCTYKAFTFNTIEEFNLKVVLRGTKICCYVNDELVFGYRDANVLKGTRWGVRSGAANVTFSNIFVTNDYLY